MSIVFKACYSPEKSLIREKEDRKTNEQVEMRMDKLVQLN